jgi:hypothetical protein
MIRLVHIAVAGVSLLTAGAAVAGPRDDAINEMLRCANMADAAARHACFDAAIPQLKAAAQTAPVGETPATAQSAPPQQQAAADDDSWLGDWNPFKGVPSRTPTQQQMAYQPLGAEILPITIGVADYAVNSDGYSVTLDNGQVWKNHSRMGQTPPFNMGGKNTVTIQHATLGGFHLLLNGKKDRYRVVRVK